MAVATPFTEKTDEQKAITEMVHQFVDEQILPNAEHYDHEDSFPEPIVEQMKELGLFGVTIPEEFDGMGLDLTTYAMIVEELSRGWISISGIVNTHFIGSYLLMKFGTEEQKQKYLPRMATGDALGCFGLTEPDSGSDPGSMRTRARRDGPDWVLDGAKMWITNGTLADVAVVWAGTDEGIRGFVVPTNLPGFTAREVPHKLSLRASITAELVFEGVRLPAEAAFPEVRGLKGPLSCLNEARFGIAWGVVGAARACYESALDYAGTREQFGKPIAGFQLTQRKLADMVVEVNRAGLLALHVGKLKDAGTLHPHHVSLAKLANVRSAIEVARSARTVLGANGITLDYPVMRHANNLETVLTYEGTEEVHALTVGQSVTGLSAFR